MKREFPTAILESNRNKIHISIQAFLSDLINQLIEKA